MSARAGIEQARREARCLVERYGVTAPQHIVIEDFAFRAGVTIIEAPLAGATAQLVNPRWGRPKIVLSDRLVEPDVRRFTIAHELGHYVLEHPSPSFVEMCDPLACEPARRKGRDVEAEANAFASELLMPDALVRPICVRAQATLDPALRIARTFRVSVRASAIRFTELTDAACAAVLSTRGVVRWAALSPQFPVSIVAGQLIDSRSLAWAYVTGDAPIPGPRHVPAAGWVKGVRKVSLVEHSIACRDRDAVLTMLWAIPDARAAITRAAA